jgi:hypothetical protein
MTFLLVLALVLLLFGSLAFLLLRADPARLAQTLRLVLPGLLGLAGLMLTVLGRAAIGMLLMSTAAGWIAAQRRRAAARKSPGGRSSVRSAALEMELEHDSGRMEGVVLAGRFAGRELGQMSLVDLLELRREIAADADSLRLLEAYLDGRFSVWREDAHADPGDGLGQSPGSGAMTKEEAYQILGLEPGAAATEIRKAHRRLMQRVHPDLGGSSFLAARINQAKDVLLRGH